MVLGHIELLIKLVFKLVFKLPSGNVKIAMAALENHYVSWVYPQKNAIFHSYVANYQRLVFMNLVPTNTPAAPVAGPMPLKLALRGSRDFNLFPGCFCSRRSR